MLTHRGKERARPHCPRADVRFFRKSIRFRTRRRRTEVAPATRRSHTSDSAWLHQRLGAVTPATLRSCTSDSISSILGNYTAPGGRAPPERVPKLIPVIGLTPRDQPTCNRMRNRPQGTITTRRRPAPPKPSTPQAKPPARASASFSPLLFSDFNNLAP